ncbi:MAG: HlyD family efflux transporter periplasmic adaptor subunit [Bryobacteraceae bacterium]
MEAVKVFSVQVPRLAGSSGRITLTRIVTNGTRVGVDDQLAEFDRTGELDAAREAKAKYQDLVHQVEQRRAENNSTARQRIADIQQAQADLDKAQLKLKIAETLSEIDRLKNEVRLKDATERVASLKKADALRTEAETASLRVLELQRDREKLRWERAQANAERLLVRAPMAGIVALESVWRTGTLGHPQEGDQLWGGQRLLRVFDPAEMRVRAFVDEPDVAALTPGCRAEVRLDAYPGAVLRARLESASPAATAALGTPLKTFDAIFRFERHDDHLMPDLSAALTIDVGGTLDATATGSRKRDRDAQ